MSIKIRLATFIDITRTNQVNKSKNPNDLTRNQQRNWETVIQLLGLRCQPMFDGLPIKHETVNSKSFGFDIDQLHSIWTFDFEVEHSSVFDDGVDPLGYLILDFDKIPIITNLEETYNIGTSLIHTSGPLVNSAFCLL